MIHLVNIVLTGGDTLILAGPRLGHAGRQGLHEGIMVSAEKRDRKPLFPRGVDGAMQREQKHVVGPDGQGVALALVRAVDVGRVDDGQGHEGRRLVGLAQLAGLHDGAEVDFGGNRTHGVC